jgi:hypothetical protein
MESKCFTQGGREFGSRGRGGLTGWSPRSKMLAAARCRSRRAVRPAGSGPGRRRDRGGLLDRDGGVADQGACGAEIGRHSIGAPKAGVNGMFRGGHCDARPRQGLLNPQTRRGCRPTLLAVQEHGQVDGRQVACLRMLFVNTDSPVSAGPRESGVMQQPPAPDGAGGPGPMPVLLQLGRVDPKHRVLR